MKADCWNEFAVAVREDGSDRAKWVYLACILTAVLMETKDGFIEISDRTLRELTADGNDVSEKLAIAQPYTDRSFLRLHLPDRDEKQG